MKAAKATRYADPDAPVVLIQMAGGHDLAWLETEVAEIRRLTDVNFGLVAIEVPNWNDDLSPWPAPAVFGREGFGGRAADTLAEVLKYCSGQKQGRENDVLHCTEGDKTYIIGGYSLAGLFALWAAYQTNVFKAVAVASPSVWFPGFAEYMGARRPDVDSVYLSLGNKEEKTRNPVMATVGDRIREAHELLKQQGIRTVLEWNQGNHFKEPDIRTAKAFAWVLNNRI